MIESVLIGTLSGWLANFDFAGFLKDVCKRQLGEIGERESLALIVASEPHALRANIS